MHSHKSITFIHGYKVATNTESLNTELLLLGKIKGKISTNLSHISEYNRILHLIAFSRNPIMLYRFSCQCHYETSQSHQH